jgi:hypothetical protein
MSEDGRVENPLTVLTTEDLRQRHSIKWRGVDPDVMPAWIAEMDTPLAEPIARALRQATDRGDTGYAIRADSRGPSRSTRSGVGAGRPIPARCSSCRTW